MKINDLSDQVIEEVYGQDRYQINPIIILIVQQLVFAAINWFISNYQDDILKAIQKFITFFKNLNIWNLFLWNRKTKEVFKNFKSVKFNNSGISKSLSGKFASLDEAAIKSLFEEVIAAKKMSSTIVEK